MDELNKIRKAYFDEGENKNQLAIRFNRSWATVDALIETSREDLSNRGKRPERRPTVVTSEVVNAIEELLDVEEALKVKKKQRYTAKWIFKKLVAENLYKGKIRTLRQAVSKIRKDRSQSKSPSFLPLEFELGSTIQIDHGEVEISLNGQRLSGYLFVASVPGATIRYCQFFLIKSMEAWGEFHERTFLFFNGIFPSVIYDNDSVLVKEILGSDRKQTNFSLSLEEHYNFTSRFCNKGAGNEKGSVENAVGFCRRNYFAGIKEFDDLSGVNKYLESECRDDIDQSNHYKTGVSLISLSLEVRKKLNPMTSAKSWVRWEDAKVNSYQLVSWKSHSYSVPERYVGSVVRLSIGIDHIMIFHNHELIASHSHQFIKGKDSLYLDHYLDQLQTKPGALWDCKAMKTHSFEPDLMRLWGCLKNRFESRTANKEFIKILILRRQYSKKEFMTGINLALEYGAVGHAAITNILNQLTVASPVYPESDWLLKRLPHIANQNYTWNFDISQYAELTKEVGNVE